MAIDKIKLNIHFADADLDAEELDRASRRLLAQLKDLDEVESVERVVDPNPPAGNKSPGGFLPGILRTEVRPPNLKPLFNFLEKRSGSPIEIEVEIGERKVKVKANSQEELAAALQAVQQLIGKDAVSQSAAHQSASQPIRTILILAANSKDASRLRLDQEVRDIAEGLARSQYRDRFTLQPKWAVRPRDLQRSLLDHSPQIVHFCGHGQGSSSFANTASLNGRKMIPLDDQGSAGLDKAGLSEAGLVFEDDTGNMKLIDGASLAGLFRLFAEQVECVVLNACYSETQATAIAQHIPYVIGMNRAIGDRAAIEFAVGFYDALGAGRSIEFAYDLACNAIQLAGIPEQLTPVLKKRAIVQRM
jgi:CHAT domain